MKQYLLKQKDRCRKESLKKVRAFLVCSAMLLVIGSVFVYKVQCDRQFAIQQQLARKVLRFHVLANSDSAKDQELKLKVRDAIGGYMRERVPACKDKEESKKRITEHLEEIEEVAMDVLVKEGYFYEVEAYLTECNFPVKTYGEYTFPAGNYEALQVIIGEGKGQNWWCVLYPNMCFENSIYEVVDDKAKDALRQVLDENEYEAVLESGKYEIRFRFLEWFR